MKTWQRNRNQNGANASDTVDNAFVSLTIEFDVYARCK